MAWKELLNKGQGEPRPAEPEGGASRDRNGLIDLVCGDTVPADTDNMPGTSAKEVCVQLPDGYIRRTPVQEYRTAPDFKRKRIRRAVTAVIVLILLALLIMALFNSGLVRLS